MSCIYKVFRYVRMQVTRLVAEDLNCILVCDEAHFHVPT